MKTYYVSENNSGGHYRVAKMFKDHVKIEAPSANEAIWAFERQFDLDWNRSNSFEGDSCKCCGRRFLLSMPEPETVDYDKYR